ncbi:MAG TPA: hypothetical protein VFN76_00405 [Candidatus Limnocylindria bacterium]|nr:hypothetical protein [Candidatus Limnocylindria bacterium]
MTQLQQTFTTPRVAITGMLMVSVLVIGMVSGIALAGSSLLGGLGRDHRVSHLTPAVLLSGLQWERQREQQRMFGDDIPPGWFQD